MFGDHKELFVEAAEKQKHIELISVKIEGCGFQE
jgi:hypothetical protein